eukprot:GHVN01080676.1.p1 GENE.GHVN01080676.1~~GHVN01080676.1.p1  ORF type:complete len:465 (+),score=51.31 GHVN01080676.1:177-1571(+)
MTPTGVSRRSPLSHDSLPSAKQHRYGLSLRLALVMLLVCQMGVTVKTDNNHEQPQSFITSSHRSHRSSHWMRFGPRSTRVTKKRSPPPEPSPNPLQHPQAHTAHQSTQPQQPFLSTNTSRPTFSREIDSFVFMTIDDEPALMTVEDERVIRADVGLMKSANEFRDYEVTVYQWGMGHRLVLRRENRKLALERTPQPDGSYMMVHLPNNNDYSSNHEDMFFLKLYKRFELNKLGIHPFIIVAHMTTQSGYTQEIIVGTNDEGNFQGQIRPLPSTKGQFYAMKLVKNNSEFKNTGDGFMFENKLTHGWFDVHAGTARTDWPGIAPLKSMTGTAMFKVWWQTRGATKNHWIIRCPSSRSGHTEITEGKRYLPVKSRRWQLYIDGGGRKGIWAAKDWQSDDYARIVKDRDPSGWEVTYRVGCCSKGISAISTQGSKPIAHDLWQIWRILADVKEVMKFTQADIVLINI